MTNNPNEITSSELLPLIRKSARREALSVGEFTIQKLSGGAGMVVLGVYRFSGTVRDPEGDYHWSLMLKVLSPNAPGLPSTVLLPSSWGYWKREAEIYASNLFESLPSGLRSPVCYALETQPDGSIWMWLEEIHSDGLPWTIARLSQAARAIGLWNGLFVTGTPIPEAPGLSRDWLCSFTEDSAEGIRLLAQNLDHPNLGMIYTRDVAEMILQTWEDKEKYLAVLAGLTQTLCHMDYFCRNLMIRRTPAGDEIVALDWAFTGRGALGEDLVALILGSLGTAAIGWEFADTLEGEVLAGYLAGLREAGWKGDERLVWQGYAAAGALRYGAALLGSVPLQLILDGIITPETMTPFGVTIRELGESTNRVNRRFTARLALEALKVVD